MYVEKHGVSLCHLSTLSAVCKVWVHLLSNLIDFPASSSGNLSVGFLRALREIHDSNVILIYGIMHTGGYRYKMLW